MIGKAVGLFVFALLTFGVLVVGVVTIYWAGDVLAEPIREGSSSLDMARMTVLVLFGMVGVVFVTVGLGAMFWESSRPLRALKKEVIQTPRKRPSIMKRLGIASQPDQS